MPAKPKRFTLTSEHTSRADDGTLTYGAVAAADIATALLKHTNVNSMTDLVNRLNLGDETVSSKMAAVILTEPQMQALELYHAEVDLLRLNPTVYITECKDCGAVQAVVAAIAKCSLTLGCTGKPVKSGAAKKLPYTEPQ